MLQLWHCLYIPRFLCPHDTVWPIPAVVHSADGTAAVVTVSGSWFRLYTAQPFVQSEAADNYIANYIAHIPQALGMIRYAPSGWIAESVRDRQPSLDARKNHKYIKSS